jgi:hypothetical protein
MTGFVECEKQFETASQRLRDVSGFAAELSRLEDFVVEVDIFKRRKRDLHAVLPQQRLPLFDPVSLSGRRVIEERHNRKHSHDSKLDNQQSPFGALTVL